MTPLWTMPELWLGLGMLAFLGYVWFSGGRERKRMRVRMARIVNPGHKTTLETAQSLRRKQPGDGDVFSQRLARFSATQRLQGRLDVAGLTLTPKGLLKRMALFFTGTVLLIAVVLGKPLVLGILLGILTALGVPHLSITRKIRKRQITFIKLFPDAIDLMVRGLRAGLPIGESFHTVSREIPDPVGPIFATVTQQAQLGLPMEKALSDAALKLNLTEFDFFVTTLILQRETGGNLGEILSNLSDMLRQRQMMKLKIHAISSEARASAIIIGVLPFFVFAMLSLLSPQYLQPLYDDYRGNLSLLAALGTLGLGGLIMNRMTKLEM